jgi:hypothetical protein
MLRPKLINVPDNFPEREHKESFTVSINIKENEESPFGLNPEAEEAC